MRIKGCEKFKLYVKDGRIITLPPIFHILEFNINLIYVSKMTDAGLHTMFEKKTYQIVQGEVALMRGIDIITLYNLLALGKHY
jgi:hypothetical protein